MTSRGRLSGLASARIIGLEGLATADGLRLLDLAAGPDRVAAEPEAASAVVAACAGSPLALRLAGAVLAARPGLSVARLADDCAGPRVLDVLAADDSSVRAAIDSSYRALANEARSVFCLAAAAIPGEIPAWALTELADGDNSVGDKLAAVGLLMPAHVEVAGKRYRMHTLVRAYASERASHRDFRSAEALARLRAGWLHRADRAATRLPGMPFVVAPAALRGQPRAQPAPECEEAWLEDERANLLATAEQACATGDHTAAMALATRMTADLCRAGAFQDAIQLWRNVAAAAEAAGDTASAAMADCHLAVSLAATHEQLGEATALLCRALPELERADEVDAAAMGYALLGRCAIAQGRHAAAIRAARCAQRLARCAKDGDLARCCATAVLGLTLGRVGIATAGLERCLEAVSLAARLGEPAYEAYATRAMAQVLLLSGAYSAAADACSDGIVLCERVGSQIGVARFRLLLGRAYQCMRHGQAAAENLLKAGEVFADCGLATEETCARSLLAAGANSAADPPDAARHVRDVSKDLARSAG